MARVVRCGLIQASCEWSPEKLSLAQIKQKMMAKHEQLIASAAKKKVQILGLQELFYGPYFCAEQQTRWYELTERVPNGPTIARMQKLAKQHQMVLVVPVYRSRMTGLYYNAAAVIDADGRYLGNTAGLPIRIATAWEKFYFTPGNSGYPFQTRHARVGVSSATTAISQKAHDALVERRGDCLQSVRDRRRTFRYLWELGSPLTPSPTNICRRYQSVGTESRGKSANSTARLFLQSRGKIVARPAATKTNCWSRTGSG
jgi:hypothetical protein